MSLLGPLGILFWVGLAIFAVGHALFWPVLAKHGGLARETMLSVIFDEGSSMRRPEHRGDRVRFRVAVFLIGIGLMTFYTSLSVGDDRELRVCRQRCLSDGYFAGHFAASDRAKSLGRTERGCFCKTAAGAVVELEQRAVPGLLPPASSSR